MNIKGFLGLISLIIAIVIIIWIAVARHEDQVIEEVKAFDEVKFELTRVNMTALERVITSFIVSEGRTPENLNEVQALRFQPAAKLDAWGRAIKYEKLSDENFRLISAGKDGVFDTEDDIVLND